MLTMEELRLKYGFDEVQMLDIRATVTTALKDIIPIIVSEITPDILRQSKDVITLKANELANESLIREQQDQEAYKYINEHKLVWENGLKDRKHAYEQYIRCNSHIELYNECLEEQPIYIPRKFRSDKRHTLSEREKCVVDKMNYNNMISEIGILKIRRDFYQQNIDLGDQNFMVFIESCPTNIKSSLRDIWQKPVKQDEAKANELSVRKMESTRIAFQKDKAEMNPQNVVEEANQEENTATIAPPTVHFQEPQSFGYHIQGIITNQESPESSDNPSQSESNLAHTFGYRHPNTSNNTQHPRTTNNRRNDNRPPRFQQRQNNNRFDQQNNHDHDQRFSKNDQARRYPERNRQQTQTYGQRQFSTYQRGHFQNSN